MKKLYFLAIVLHYLEAKIDIIGNNAMNLFKKTTIFITLISVFTLLVGCAKFANYQPMIVDSPKTTTWKNPKLKGAIEVVNISGGQDEINPLLESHDNIVSNDVLRKALEGSLKAYGYLANTSSKAKYKLDAKLVKLGLPTTGSLGINVDSVIVYEIYGSGTAKRYSVNAYGKVEWFEKTMHAAERSIKENISDFLKQLHSF